MCDSVWPERQAAESLTYQHPIGIDTDPKTPLSEDEGI